jgi:hypothetical protein
VVVIFLVECLILVLELQQHINSYSDSKSSHLRFQGKLQV